MTRADRKLFCEACRGHAVQILLTGIEKKVQELLKVFDGTLVTIAHFKSCFNAQRKNNVFKPSWLNHISWLNISLTIHLKVRFSPEVEICSF